MKQWMSLGNRYSIYDYRNMCDILGVNPDGQKRIRARQRGADANSTMAAGKVSNATMLKSEPHALTVAARR